MRDEMLKRLDELMCRLKAASGRGFTTTPPVIEMWRCWEKIRAELVAERCENCAHSYVEPDDSRLCVLLSDCESGAWPEYAAETSTRVWIETEPGFCCSHFMKKEL